MYVDTIRSLLESADSNRTGLTIPSCTLNTVRLPNGNVGILSYDSARVGEITQNGDVYVYEGHRGMSRTTDGHLRRITDHFDDARLVSRPANPMDGPVPETIKYAGNYIGGYDEMSGVESLANEDVRTTMRRRLKHRS